MTRSIRLAEDTIESHELDALCEWIKGGPRLTKAELTREFELRFSEYVGSRHSVFVNSGSSANLLMLYGLDMAGRLPRRRVIAPAISWSTTVAPAIQLRMEIELCDCDTVTLGIDPEHFESLCRTFKPDVAIVVHVLGHPCRMDDILSICDRYGVILLEDACEALGTRVAGRHAGTIGAAGSYSLYFGHQLSTIEGGVITTDDRELYNVFMSLRAHGWARDLDPDVKTAWERDYDIDEVRSLYTFYYPGFNFRPTDLNAFLGLSQLKKADEVAIARQANFAAYRDALAPAFWAQQSDADQLSSFAFGTFVKNRVDVHLALAAASIESRPLICGSVGRQPFWIRQFGPRTLPNADFVHDYGIYVPNNCRMDRDDVARVAAVLHESAVPAFFPASVTSSSVR